MEAAYDMLRRYARGHNQRLVEVARQVVNRELDPIALDPAQPAPERP